MSVVFVGPLNQDGRAILTSAHRDLLDAVVDRITEQPWRIAIDTEGYAYQISRDDRRLALRMGAHAVSRQTITELAVAYTQRRGSFIEDELTNSRGKKGTTCQKNS